MGSSGSPRKRNFVLDLLKSLPVAISATKISFFKKTEIPKTQKIENLQNRPENQQLGPKLIQDDSPSLNNPCPTISGQIPDKNPPKIPSLLCPDGLVKGLPRGVRWKSTAVAIQSARSTNRPWKRNC